MPYFLYLMLAAERKRPELIRSVGTILPVDHSFWSSHFPPNGWGCKCAVRQISANERQDYLGRPDSGEPDAIAFRDTPPPPARNFVNRRKGEQVEVPIGIDPVGDVVDGPRLTLSASMSASGIHNDYLLLR